MRITKILLAVLFVVSIFMPMQSARADMAPPPAPQLGGLEPFQYQKTNVQMVYERVEMEIEPFFSLEDDFSRPESRLNVTAYFTMHNLGSVSESMQVIFPLESFTNCEEGVSMGNSYTYYQVDQDSFEVIVDGNTAPVQKVVTDHPHKGCQQMTWAGFNVTFPANEDVVVRVHYVMESLSIDSMQNIEYILETGAGWVGPIQRGYVVVKFPYTATIENVLSESTPGHQFLYNEIFWSFENLEPTSENNIQVSIISPNIWQEILSLRRDLKANPESPEKWLKLAQIYLEVSTWHSTNVRNDYYYQKVSPTFEKGITFNPNAAFLYSNYAEFLHYDCCFFLEGKKIDPVDQARIFDLVNKALSLDPTDPIALQIVDLVKFQNPDLTFTPPPTVPPTATSLFTTTPSITPSATITPTSTETPIVVTVIHTKIVNAPTFTQMPQSTAMLVPTEADHQNETQKESNPSTMIFGALVVFVVGAGSGWFLSKRQKK